MKDILEKLTIEMTRVNPQGFAKFNKGITSDAINGLLKGFPIHRDKFTEVLNLLQWRNGGLECMGGGVDVSFIPGYMLLSLHEIVDYYAFTQCVPWCGKNLIRFLSDDSSGGYHYDIRNQNIVHTMPEFSPIRYKSMTGFLNAIYECYKDNVFYLQEDGMLTSNYEKENEAFSREIISNKRN